jgi:hypothetical protein
MRAKIRGKYWRIEFASPGPKADGICDRDGQQLPKQTIRIKPGLAPEREMAVIIHELMHAGLWDLAEDPVDELSSDIARILTKLGYKRS